MRLYRLAVTAVLVVAFAVGANAFDGQKKGFILGGGLGFGMTSFTQSFEGGGISITSDRENKGAFGTDFRIGWGVNERTAVYYTGKISWFGIDNGYGESVTIADGIHGLGVTHSFRAWVPTWFVTGGLALATWSAPFETNSGTWNGFGFYVGTGYEFSKHYGVEFDVVYGNPGDSEGGFEASTNSTSFKATFNALAY
jgi:opacity protein-like surface antigen